MATISDFTRHLVKKDVNILLSEDESVIRNGFPKKFIDPSFHNHIILELMRLGEEILDAGDPATPETFKLRNYRKHIINEYMSEINQAKDCLSDYKAYILEEFMDANNGEDLTEYLASPEMLFMFEALLRDYAGTPKFNQFLEKIYLDAHDANYLINNYGIEPFYEELQQNIQTLQSFFPQYGLDYRDATALLMRLTIHTLEHLINGGELATNLVRPIENTSKSNHYVARVRKTEVRKLFEFFNEVIEELPELDDPEQQKNMEHALAKFKSKLMPLKIRYDNCPFDKVPIHTRELENIVLMNIITYTPYLLVPFIKFLIDNNIRVPLSNYKCDLYPSYFIDFDNSTIQKAFIFELEDEMVDMDDFRQHVLSPEELEEANKNLIHIEKEHKKSRKVKVSKPENVK